MDGASSSYPRQVGRYQWYGVEDVAGEGRSSRQSSKERERRNERKKETAPDVRVPQFLLRLYNTLMIFMVDSYWKMNLSR